MGDLSGSGQDEGYGGGMTAAEEEIQVVAAEM